MTETWARRRFLLKPRTTSTRVDVLTLSLVDALKSIDDPVVVVLGAHCDDIEIGAGATLYRLAESVPGLRVVATVMASTPPRAAEQRAALPAFLPGAQLDLQVLELPDGRLPEHWLTVKEAVHELRDRARKADVVFSPWLGDAHQDHRLLGEIVPTVFRDHPVLQYEILKYDGDIGRPNVYVSFDRDEALLKSRLLHQHYLSQHAHTWFDDETFLALMRIRGVECNARYAEAFYASKLVL